MICLSRSSTPPSHLQGVNLQNAETHLVIRPRSLFEAPNAFVIDLGTGRSAAGVIAKQSVPSSLTTRVVIAIAGMSGLLALLSQARS